MHRLYLHIGYPKTGTTALQRFLAGNRPALAAQGVLYPDAGRVGDAHYGLNFALGIAAYDRPAGLALPDDLAAAIAAEAAAAGASSVIVSSEYFATADLAAKERVKAALAGFDVRVVVYLRRHDDALESGYVQAIRSVADPPWQRSIQGFILYHLGMGTVSYDYLGVLRQWAQVFGTGNVIVRPYEAAQNRPDLMADFLAAVGVADGPGFTRPAARNQSFGPRTAAAIELLRRLPIEAEVQRHVLARLLATAARGREAERFLTPVERQAIVRRYIWMYRQIASEFLGRADGVLFTAPMPLAGPAEPGPRAYSDEELFAVILSATAPRG